MAFISISTAVRSKPNTLEAEDCGGRYAEDTDGSGSCVRKPIDVTERFDVDGAARWCTVPYREEVSRR